MVEPTTLTAAIAGDDQALEELIRVHEPRIYALARAILRQQEWAEDATQETLLRMIQRLPQFDSNDDRFDMWVLCIARNVAFSLWRKRRVRGEVGAQPDEAEAPTETNASIDFVIRQEDVARIVAAIDTLPEAVREVMVLRFFHNLEPAEIAKIVETPAGTVRVKLSRAIQQLRERLQGAGSNAGSKLREGGVR